MVDRTVRPPKYVTRMKKLFLMLMLTITSLVAFADDRCAYVSNVEHYRDQVVVTVSAKESAIRQYPDGFMVGVRPANKLFDLMLTNSRAEKTVRLTKQKPSATVTFYCDENYTGSKACNRNDFVVNSKP